MTGSQWQGYLFDFDYTLADSSPGIERCMQAALASQGLPPAGRREIQATIGLALPAAFQRLVPGRPELHAPLAAEFVWHADRIMVAHTEFFPASLRIMRLLKRQGARLGIVTTKYRRRIEAVLARDHAAELIDVIVGGDEVSDPKPHPEALLLGMRRLQVRPGSILYIGDSVVDAACARAAGAPFLGVASGPTPASALRQQGAWAVASGISGILPYLRQR